VDRLTYLPPGNELGVCVPVNSIVGRSSIASVGLIGIVAYSAGLSLRFAVEWVDPDLVQKAAEPWLPFGRRGRQFLKLGARFADGQVFTNVDGNIARTLGLPTGLREDLIWWVPRIPTQGGIELFCEWPIANIATSKLELDGADVRRAAATPPIQWTAPA